MRHRETESGSVADFLRGEERIEYAVNLLRRNSASVVGDAVEYLAVSRFGRELDSRDGR